MATKKLTVDDFTNQPQALTAEDVNGQDARTRTWQSLNYMYGKQQKQSEEQYAQAQAQSLRNALARGMQRSSYAIATAANIAQKGIEASNDIYAAKIADYQNRIGQIEQQELENEWREKEFNEKVRQYDEGMGLERERLDYQKVRDSVADKQWEKQYEESLRQFNEQMAYQRERANVSDAQWEKEYAEKLRQFNEQMAENKRQFDLQFELQKSSSTGGSGGGGGGTGADNGNNTPPPTGLTDEEMFRQHLELGTRDAALSTAKKTTQSVTSTNITSTINNYQNQINQLSQKLRTASSNSERQNINNQITALQKKINTLKNTR